MRKRFSAENDARARRKSRFRLRGVIRPHQKPRIEIFLRGFAKDGRHRWRHRPFIFKIFTAQAHHFLADLAPQPVHDAFRHETARIFYFHLACGKNGVSEPQETFRNVLRRRRLLSRPLRRLLRCRRRRMPRRIRRAQPKRFSRSRRKRKRKRRTTRKCFAIKCFLLWFQDPEDFAARKRRFLRAHGTFPVLLPPNRRRVRKSQPLFRRHIRHAGHRFHCRRKRRHETETVPYGARRRPGRNAAIARCIRRPHRAGNEMVLIAVRVAAIKFRLHRAKKRLRVTSVPARQCGERAPIRRDDRVHIRRLLHAPLDFERHDARFRKRRQPIQRKHIFERKPMRARVPHGPPRLIDQSIRHPTRLRARPAVSAPPADERTHEALPGIAHAKRPVHKDFDFRLRPVRDFGNFRKRKLPREHDARKSERGEETDARQVRHRHLRARMQRHMRNPLPRQMRHAQILHQKPVGRNRSQEIQILAKRRHFRIGHQRIQRHIHEGAERMADGNGLRHLFL